MRKSAFGMGLAVPLVAFGISLTGSGTASATLVMQKKAKEAGIAAQNCMHCHQDKLPKKGASVLNDRGKWLVAEKEKKQAKEVDVTWLKDYKEPTK